MKSVDLLAHGGQTRKAAGVSKYEFKVGQKPDHKEQRTQ